MAYKVLLEVDTMRDGAFNPVSNARSNVIFISAASFLSIM